MRLVGRFGVGTWAGGMTGWRPRRWPWAGGSRRAMPVGEPMGSFSPFPGARSLPLSAAGWHQKQRRVPSRFQSVTNSAGNSGKSVPHF